MENINQVNEMSPEEEYIASMEGYDYRRDIEETLHNDQFDAMIYPESMCAVRIPPVYRKMGSFSDLDSAFALFDYELAMLIEDRLMWTSRCSCNDCYLESVMLSVEYYEDTPYFLLELCDDLKKYLKKRCYMHEDEHVKAKAFIKKYKKSPYS